MIRAEPVTFTQGVNGVFICLSLYTAVISQSYSQYADQRIQDMSAHERTGVSYCPALYDTG